MGSERRFITEGFAGAVLLKEYLQMPNTAQCVGIVGRVSILRDEDIVGFESSRGETNWVARIEGDSSSVTILGCQIRGVVDAPLGSMRNPNYYVVP